MPADLTVVIPSRSRAHRCRPLEDLLPAACAQAMLVVPQEQASEYAPLAERHGVRLLTHEPMPLAKKREWAVRQVATRKFLMLDDDINFLMRKQPDSWQLGNCRGEDTWAMLQLISQLLDTYHQVALSPREGQHTMPYPQFECGRAMRAVAYATEAFLSVEHGRVQVMEDFDVTLQLLRRGQPNCIVTAYANGQGNTNASGGCSDWRTVEIHNASVQRLAELHPGYVRIRNNVPRQAGELSQRLEVTVQWRAACRDAQAKDGLLYA